MAVSVSGGLSTNGHLCDLPLLSTGILQTRSGDRSKEGASFLSWVVRVCGAAGLLSQEQALLGTGWGGQAEPVGL